MKNDDQAEKVREMLKGLPDRQRSNSGRAGSRASSRGGYRPHSQLSRSSNSSFGSSIIGGGGYADRRLTKQDSYLTSPGASQKDYSVLLTDARTQEAEKHQINMLKKILEDNIGQHIIPDNN